MYLHLAISLLALQLPTHLCAKVGDALAYVCQGHKLPTGAKCNVGLINIASVTVITTTNTTAIQSATTGRECGSIEQCRRTILRVEDSGLSIQYKHLYQWVLSKCQGKSQCDQQEEIIPKWWDLVDEFSECDQSGIQYFAAILIDIECYLWTVIPTAPPPPATLARTKPATPATTPAQAALVAIYQPSLIGREKVILGVAIGLSIAIILVLLLIFYCYEKYRKRVEREQVMRRLGSPTAQSGDNDMWGYSKRNADATGEYSGIKPDEFLTVHRYALGAEPPYRTPVPPDWDNQEESIDDYIDRAFDIHPDAYSTFYNNRSFSYKRNQV